ncbi:MAG: SAM-dependent methyltransferase [Thermoplasmata archaeon]|nr:SAM-dependent methyltransferase [Thermoplasmata archaeon]MCI4359360.1 SAM-dependent methyltransferase [Thermoplasmata archaeon]
MRSEPGESAPPTAGDPAEPILDAERIREREVRRRLIEAAGPGGWLRFDRFVEIALYASGVGFYTEPEASVGPAAAFYTAAHVSSLFGATIADRIADEYARLARPPTFTVVEVGCGDGTLSADVIRALAGRLGDAPGLRYLLVDRSPALRARAVDRATAVAEGTPVEVEAVASLAENGPFPGVVLANELLDALPFQRRIRRPEGWRELGVTVTGDSIVWRESEGTESPPPVGMGPAEPGAIAEVCPAAEGFVREVADHLTDGVALLLDYGGEEGPLLRDHPSGTLAAVRRQRPMPDPLAHPGLLDLSAFVNFSRIRAAARSAGLHERAFRPQAQALVAWGLERRTEEALRASEGAEETVRTRLAVKNLLFGFSTFFALELSAGDPSRPTPPTPATPPGEVPPT